ncbi:hypothetical protein V7x_41000 [Crateriforma conspicua]|uniref:Uncharacterized protein n=1 Tax=Crateriforma conspicua TaxID=2527996 RepID=A0A5C6FQJ4_9PLAN|nr:hypothetical protein V7x_41000 [Crateriforma conspicua]
MEEAVVADRGNDRRRPKPFGPGQRPRWPVLNLNVSRRGAGPDVVLKPRASKCVFNNVVRCIFGVTDYAAMIQEPPDGFDRGVANATDHRRLQHPATSPSRSPSVHGGVVNLFPSAFGDVFRHFLKRNRMFVGQVKTHRITASTQNSRRSTWLPKTVHWLRGNSSRPNSSR